MDNNKELAFEWEHKHSYKAHLRGLFDALCIQKYIFLNALGRQSLLYTVQIKYIHSTKGTQINIHTIWPIVNVNNLNGLAQVCGNSSTLVTAVLH